MASVVLGAAAGAIAKSAFGGVASTLFASGWTAAAASAATSTAVVGAATAVGTAIGGYIDSAYLFPALFGDEGSNESRYGSVTVSTADEGSPIYTGYGSRIRVPGLILYAADPREVRNQVRVSKRRTQAQSTWYADVVVAFGKSYPALDGNLSEVRAVLADGKPIIDKRDPIVIETVSGSTGTGENRVAGLVVNNQEHREFRTGTASGTYLYAGARGLRTTPTLRSDVLTVTAYADGPAVNPVGGSLLTGVYVFFDVAHGVEPGAGFMAYATSGPSAGTYPWCWMRADLDHPRKAWLPGIADNLGNTLQDWVWEGIHRPSGWTFRVADDVPDGNVDYDLSQFVVGLYPEIRDDGVVIWRPNLPFQTGRTLSVRGIAGQLQEMVNAGRFEEPGYPAADGSVIRIEQDRVPYNLNAIEGGAEDVGFVYEDEGPAYQEVDPTVENWVLGNPAPGFRDLLYLTVGNLNLSSFGNRIPNIEGIVRGQRTSLPDVLTDICTHHGLAAERIDVTAVPAETVEGYRYSGIVDGRQALQPLLLVYDLLVQQSDDSIRFFPRSDSTVVAVPGDDFVTGERGQRLQLRRRDQQAPLRSVSVKFFDSRRNLEPGTVTEPGFADQSGEDRSINTNMTMTEDRAREIARRVLRDGSRPTWSVRCSLPWTWAHIVENDIITTTIDGTDYRFRVLGVELGSALELVIEGLTEPVLPSGSVAAAETTTDGRQSTIPGQELIRSEVWQGYDWDTGQYLDGGFFVAATSSNPGGPWPGAEIFVSADSGTTWRAAGFVNQKTAIGTLAAPGGSIDEAAALAWEPDTSAVVSLDDGELESVTEAEVRGRGSNRLRIGDEVLAFQTATELPGSDYVLSGFLRGLGGTRGTTHAIGEPVVLLGDDVERVMFKPHEIGQVVAVKVVPFGLTLDEVPTTTVTAEPADPMPVEPVTVQGFAAVAAGDAVQMSWLEAEGAELYEIRTGSEWLGARVVGQTTETSYEWTPPAQRSITFQIRARFPGGYWSPEVSTATVTFAGSDVSAVVVETVEVEGYVGGTGSDATDSGGVVTMDTAAYEATWTQTSLDAGSVGDYFWDVDWEGYMTDSRTFDQVPDMALGSAEAHRWTFAGRFGDESAPGVGDWSTLADYTLAMQDYPHVRLYGPEGTPGDPTQVIIEARFDEAGTGSYTDWETFKPQWRNAQQMQARLRLRRAADHYQQTITRLRIQARS